jgi:hypothetical protein
MDRGGSPLFSPAASPLLSLLRASEARRALRHGRSGSVKLRADGGGEQQDEAVDQASKMKEN